MNRFKGKCIPFPHAYYFIMFSCGNMTVTYHARLFCVHASYNVKLGFKDIDVVSQEPWDILLMGNTTCLHELC